MRSLIRRKTLDENCTLWSFICYPSDNDVIVIVRWTLLYNIATACLFDGLLSCFSDEYRYTKEMQTMEQY